MSKNENHNEKTPEGVKPENRDTIEKENIGKVRHDEPVTVKDVARSLLMANEPEQRMDVKESDADRQE